MLLSLLPAALAADAPGFYIRQSFGGAGWPSGFISETRVQARTPIFRSDSIVFQDTYAGAGLRLDASPAFVNPGIQLSFAPVDVFDIDVSATFLGCLPGPFGLLPYDGLSSKLESVRNARTDNVPTIGVSLDANPTLKLKVGPVIAFDAVALSYIHLEQPEGVSTPYVYEPLRDLIVAWDEIYLEHQPALLYEALPGGDKPLLYVGASWRDRFAFRSGDRSGALGLLIVTRPAERPLIPTFIGYAAFYLIDQDRVGGAPFLGLQANWIFEPPFQPAEVSRDRDTPPPGAPGAAETGATREEWR